MNTLSSIEQLRSTATASVLEAVNGWFRGRLVQTTVAKSVMENHGDFWKDTYNSFEFQMWCGYGDLAVIDQENSMIRRKLWRNQLTGQPSFDQKHTQFSAKEYA